MEKVRIFDLKFEEKFRKEFYENCEQIFDEGFLTNHSFVRKLEEEFSSWSGCRFNVAVNSGSSALTAALMSLGLEKGQEVLIPTNTFVACWYATIQAGLTPVLVDIDPEFLGPDLEDILKKITPKSKVILTTHVGGIVSPQLPALKKICEEHDLFLIEDCAHAHGSSLNGIKAGSWGDLACFSFHLTKVITAGEGGLVSTNSEKLASNLKSIRQFGMSEDSPHIFDKFGQNFKMSEFTAAFLVVELKRAQERICRRQKIAGIYQEALQNSEWKLILPAEMSDCSFYKVIAKGPYLHSRMDALFKEHEVQLPNGVYYTPLHRQPIVKKHTHGLGAFRNSDDFSDHHFCLPCYPELTDDQVGYVHKTLLAAKAGP